MLDIVQDVLFNARFDEEFEEYKIVTLYIGTVPEFEIVM
jgi:hypothetical protein